MADIVISVEDEGHDNDKGEGEPPVPHLSEQKITRGEQREKGQYKDVGIK